MLTDARVMAIAESVSTKVHVPRPFPHARSNAVFVSGALSIGAIGAAVLTFGAHFMVVAFLAGLAAVNIGRRAIGDIDVSPSLYRGRNAMLAMTAAAGISTGLAACSLAAVIAAAF